MEIRFDGLYQNSKEMKKMDSKKLKQYRKKAKTRIDDIDSELYELTSKEASLETERKNIQASLDKLSEHIEIFSFMEYLDSITVSTKKSEEVK